MSNVQTTQRMSNRTDSLRCRSAGIGRNRFVVCASAYRRIGTPRVLSAIVLLLCAAIASGCQGHGADKPTALGNMGLLVNSGWDDYAPVLQDTATLVFTSNRSDGRGDGLQAMLSERRPSGLMLTMRLGSDWDAAQQYEILFGEAVKREVATITFPPVPNALNALAYITSCDEEHGGCDIYIVSGDESEGALNPGPGLNSPEWDGQPFATPDGRRLYFASARNGGFGGTDIWFVERQENGLWGSPRNAGSTVNTELDERSPFFDQKSERLYFAAENTGSGLDLFSWKAGETERRLLESPYNSPSDDFTPFIFQGRLYLSSNRDGGCGGFDLYAFPFASE